MAIVVVRSSAPDLASCQRTFPAEPIMVSEARRMAAETFASWRMEPGQAELGCLLVSEVVTNVVLHATATGVGSARDGDAGLAAARAGRFDDGLATAAGGPAASAENGLGAVAVEDRWDPFDTAPQVAEREFTLRLRRGASSIWAEVFDSDLRLPRIRSAGETDEGGRGLYLVDQLASRWGSRPTPEGKAVWFELPISG
jgi:anti-sigma regulatory factor (Ser/Thr protein kinase)